MERLIPISRKQHDSVNALIEAAKASKSRLEDFCNCLLQGVDEELGQVGVVGARCTDGVYALVVELPEIAPPAEEKTA